MDSPSVVDKIKSSTSLILKVKKYLRPEIKVRQYQIVGATLLWHCKNLLLADACGLGKTLQVLLAYAIQKEMDEQKGVKSPKLLVVTEKSALLQWPEEIDKFLQGITSMHVPAAKKGKGFSKPYEYREHLYNTADADVIVVAHRTFTQDWRKGILLDLVKNSILVLDEADLIRGEKSQAYKAFHAASKTAREFKALTATPIYTGLEDYFNLLRVVAPGIMGDFEWFLKKFCITKPLKIKTKGGVRWIKIIVSFRNVPEFHNRAKDFLLMRTPKDVGAELPELWEKPIYLEMEPAQEAIYKRAESGEFNVMPGVEKPRKKKDGNLETPEEVEQRILQTRDSKLVNQVRMLQAADHPELLGQEGPSVKLEKLLQLLQGDLLKQHVVVFSQFKTMIDKIEEVLNKAEIETCRVTGDEASVEARNASMQSFRTDGPPYVMLVTSAAKKALNLQVAGTFIFFDQPLSWGDSYQLIGRIRRLGSERDHVLVLRLMVRDTADEWVYKILSQEDDLVRDCLQKGGTMHVTPELLSHVLQRVKQGKKVSEAMRDYVRG